MQAHTPQNLTNDFSTQTTDSHDDLSIDAHHSFDDHLDSAQIDALNYEISEAKNCLVTIRDFIRFCVSKMREYDVVVAQGTNDVFAEAAAIVLHSLSLDWSADEQILECKLTTHEKNEVLTLLSERITARKPLSYLINLAYFCNMPFYVDERVLIPRSPIAELIKQQFYPYFEPDDLAQKVGKDDSFFEHGLIDNLLARPERILDLCTGSGCIALALAQFFVDAQVDASDIDKDALQVAAVNVQHHEALSHQINLIQSDLFDKIPANNQYDLIVSNPPYVDAEDMAELSPEFLHEPDHALAAGQDGLDFVHKILYYASDYLSKDGLLVCEVGNSEWALRQAYPDIVFDWLKFAHGGQGVFAISYDELVENRQFFAQYATVS